MYMTTRNYASALASINKIKQPTTKIAGGPSRRSSSVSARRLLPTRSSTKASGYFTQAINLGNYKPEAKSNAYFWRGECEYRNGNYAKAEMTTAAISTRHSSRAATPTVWRITTSATVRSKERIIRRFCPVSTNISPSGPTVRLPSLADAYNRAGDCQFENRLFSQTRKLCQSERDSSFSRRLFHLSARLCPRSAEKTTKARSQLWMN